MTFYVKVIPPHGRARVHRGECKHCRNGDGQINQDKGTGPTYWSGPHNTFEDAKGFMENLGPRYKNIGLCPYCRPGG